ncbi:MAG: alkaline phosphatase family protein [Paucibacter sp.]|nr:alkaline phosphatase family protein [Roseateles sp.]
MMKRRLLLVAAAVLAGCTQTPLVAQVLQVQQVPPDATPAKPRLVVFIAVDGLPMRQVMGERERFAPDGFRRFLDQGAWFSDAHYSHGYTVTAAGHATMLTGAPPYRSGIIGNEWRNPVTYEPVYNTGDAAYKYIGEETAPLAGTSPRNLKAETVGDVLRRVHPESKVVSVSGKDRGAILPGGHAGTAYMYMSATGHFASSTYYMAKHPQWVDSFNGSGAAEKYFGKTWAPLLAESPAAGWDQPWQNDAGNGRRLPVSVTGGLSAPGPKFYAALLPSPYADALTLEFARAAIAGEQLGAEGRTDILAVSLSGHDYINHSFGPESRMSQEHLLQLDLLLQDFLRDLDQRIGRANYMVLLTADHGFADSPEWSQRQGLDAGRLAPAILNKAMEDALAARFGPGPWLRGMSAMGYLFDEQKISQAGLDRDAVYAVARDAAKTVPGIFTAFTRTELVGTGTKDPVLTAMRKSWDPERAAPLQLVMKPRWLLTSSNRGTSHGTPWEYDQHVPLLGWGPAWLGRGEVKARVEVVDVAPTIAGILSLQLPDRSEGHPLPLPLP